MEHTRWRLFVTAALALVAAGLAMPGCRLLEPAPMVSSAEIEEAAGQIGELLARFERAVQEDDGDAIVAMLSPVVVESSSQEIESDVRIALNTWTYSDYKLYYEEALRHVRGGDVQRGRVVLNIRYRTGSGRIEEDRFVFRRFRGKWAIGDAHMRQPKLGDAMDMPAREREQILSKVEVCVNALKAGDDGYGTFITALDGKQRYAANRGEAFRSEYAQWMASIDLLFRSSLRAITFSRTRTRTLHDGKDQVAVLVPLEMKYPPSADKRYEKMTLCFLLTRKVEGWEIIDLKSSRKEKLFKRVRRLIKG